MQTLYPEIKPYARHELAVESPHVLYVDESGSPEGLPVVFVHGGPGGGCGPAAGRGGGFGPGPGAGRGPGGGRGPGDDGPQIPDIDELMKKGQDQLRVLMGGRGGGADRQAGQDHQRT